MTGLRVSTLFKGAVIDPHVIFSLFRGRGFSISVYGENLEYPAYKSIFTAKLLLGPYGLHTPKFVKFGHYGPILGAKNTRRSSFLVMVEYLHHYNNFSGRV